MIIGDALWSTSAIRYEFSNLQMTEWPKLLLLVVVMLAVCAWPWIVSFSRAFSDVGYRSSIVFAVVAVALATLFYSPIASAPSEGIGYNVIFFMLSTWAAYPLSLMARIRED